MPEELFLSTDLIEPKFRSDYWRAIMGPLFDAQAQGDDVRGLVGSVRSRLGATLMVARTQFNSQHYCRDRQVIRKSRLDDFYLIQSRRIGTADADFEGRAVSIKPGDVVAFDLSRAWSSRSSTGSTLAVMLPRAAIDQAAGGRSLHGTRLEAGSPVARLMSDFLVSLSDLPASTNGADALAVEETATMVLASTLARRAARELPAETAITQTWRRRVLAFVDANLFDPLLGPDLLLRRFQISRAHLYRMFADEGGVAAMVRKRRLEAAYRELVSPGSTRSITTIATDLAFSSSSQFLRAFRARFDMTPSEARHGGVAPAAGVGWQSGVQAHFSRMREWAAVASLS
ncbi:helix-turn-helix domain-containing protein [Bradyrhizobium prioriisuperbiae]|uniref:helix-turn-helix domain-containing protein n=1 Tax=Bradyrhizobium prioriisuperbiae TaxID=2854389 RepID=UPI0028E201B9|nr:helix-turn-helix domain-containing protein [Bradyrhizobium prioritasuperba]